jgi:hypothetical protein
MGDSGGRRRMLDGGEAIATGLAEASDVLTTGTGSRRGCVLAASAASRFGFVRARGRVRARGCAHERGRVRSRNRVGSSGRARAGARRQAGAVR